MRRGNNLIQTRRFVLEWALAADDFAVFHDEEWALQGADVCEGMVPPHRGIVDYFRLVLRSFARRAPPRATRSLASARALVW